MTRQSTWDEFIGTDWGVDTAQKTTQGAYDQYTTHLMDMRDKKGWPASMVQSLVAKGAVIEADVNSPSDFWREIAEREPGWMRAAQIEPGSLAKYDSHIDFLRAVGASTEALERAQAEYSPGSVFVAVVKETYGDIKKKADPRKSPWPWLAGAVVVLLLLRR